MKFIKKLFIAIIILIILICSIIFLVGHSYYSKALKEKPLISRIDEIKSQENFVKFEDMSSYYRNAVISVEDHRFYDHGPVDFIAIARAIYTNIKNGECYIYGMHISPYEFGNIYNKDPLRTRKLLLNKQEINKLWGKITQKGCSLVPISLYFKGSIVKLELGIGKGKKLYDKRQDIAKKEANIRMLKAQKMKLR